MLKEMDAFSAKEFLESTRECARVVPRINCLAKNRINAFQNQNHKNAPKTNTETQKMANASKRFNVKKELKKMKQAIFVFLFVHRTSITTRNPIHVKKIQLYAKLVKGIILILSNVKKLFVKKTRFLTNKPIAVFHMSKRALDCVLQIDHIGILQVLTARPVLVIDLVIIKIITDARLVLLDKFGMKHPKAAKNIALQVKH